MKIYRFIFYKKGSNKKETQRNKEAQLKRLGWSYGIDVSTEYIHTVSEYSIGYTSKYTFTLQPLNKSYVNDIEKTDFKEMPRDYLRKIIKYVLTQ